MKSLKTKVILSAFVLLFALVATIGSTYAWFTVSQTVSVSSIEMNVQSAKSILMLVDDNYDEVTDAAFLADATNYKTTLTNADILASERYDTELATWTLGHVTAGTGNTAPATDFSGLDGSALRVMDIDAKTYSAAAENSATGGYITIEFWILNQSPTAEDIVLQDLVFTSDAGNSVPQDNVVNALRLRTFDGDSNYQIFGTDPTPDYGFTFVSGMRGYDGDATDFVDTTPEGLMVGDHALFYDSVSGAVANVSSATLGLATDVITALASNTPTKISISVYLEGWDEDTTNALLSAVFTVEFTLALQSPS